MRLKKREKTNKISFRTLVKMGLPNTNEMKRLYHQSKNPLIDLIDYITPETPISKEFLEQEEQSAKWYIDMGYE